MKKIVLMLLVAFAAVALCSCGGWMDGEYHSVTPHQQQDYLANNVDAVCETYGEVRMALVDLVENGTTKGVIHIQMQAQNSIESYMDSAILYVTTKNAIGAYSVEGITYEVGTNAAVPAVAVEIKYLHNRSEILRIMQTGNMTQANAVITAALDGCKAGVVVRVNRYQATDIAQMVADYVDANPDTCMEQPQVNVSVYPDQGTDRVIEVSFLYKTSRDVLRSMQEEVRPVFSSAELYVEGNADDWEKYAQLYAFLMERYDYKIETSITPSYSLLRHGVGDSKAFATVYGQMCRKAGLDCQVVSGTKKGEPWHWNAIKVDGTYHYIDLIACKNKGAFRTYLKSEMPNYVWDYSAFDDGENG